MKKILAALLLASGCSPPVAQPPTPCNPAGTYAFSHIATGQQPDVPAELGRLAAPLMDMLVDFLGTSIAIEGTFIRFSNHVRRLDVYNATPTHTDLVDANGSMFFVTCSESGRRLRIPAVVGFSALHMIYISPDPA